MNIMNIYRFILWLATPILVVILLWRVWRKKEDPVRFMEKLGFFTQTKYSQPIWIHAVSVGEMMVGINLANIIHEHFPYKNILLTSTTVSSAFIFNKYANLAFMQHAFLPFDHPWCINRFFSYFQPKFGIFIETSFWPILLFYGSKKMTLCLLNGKMSYKSYLFWFWSRQGESLIKKFTLIYALNEINAKRFLSLGGHDIRISGNIKFLSPVLPVTHKVHFLKEKFSNRLIWVVASLHAGEEKNLFSIYSDLKKRFSNLLTIIAPRHMNDIANILEPFSHQSIALYSCLDDKYIDILVVDSIGCLGDFFSVAHVVLVGGSLIPKIGGHNVLESLKCGASTVIGPFTEDLQDFCNELIQVGALYQEPVSGLAQCIGNLLKDQEKRKKQINQYQTFEKKCLNKIQEMINIILVFLKDLYVKNT